MKLSLAVLAAVAIFALCTAIPYRWTHTLGPGCHWRSGLFSGLGRPQPSPTDNADRDECLRNKGLKSSSQILNEVRSKWPSRADLAAMENRDESPLPAQADTTELQSRPSR